MTKGIPGWTTRMTRSGSLLGLTLLAACTSMRTPDSVRELEQQAAAAIARRDTDRSAGRAVQQAGGQVALVTPGWGEAPAAPAPAPAARPTAIPPPAPADPAPLSSQVLQPVPNADEAVRHALESWREAWRRGDIAAYIASYDPKFKGTARSRADWEAQRRKRLANERIEVRVRGVEVRSSADVADVRFVQEYRSAGHTDSGVKHMKLHRNGTQWLIVEEDWSRARTKTPGTKGRH